MTWLRLTLAVLATWRITHLLVREDGPADLLFRLRRALSRRVLGRGAECFYCISVWVAAGLAAPLPGSLFERLMTAAALSGGACLLDRMGQPPVVVERLSESVKGAETDGVLRSEPTDF